MALSEVQAWQSKALQLLTPQTLCAHLNKPKICPATACD